MLTDIAIVPNRFHRVIIRNGAGHYLQLPSLTTTQRNALTPVVGMMIYNSTTSQVNAYEDSAWVAGLYTDAEAVAAVEAGSIDFANEIALPVGAVGAPSIGFTGDLTTGIYHPAASQVGVAIAGVLKATFSANGLRVGDATAPTVSLEAASGLRVVAGDTILTASHLYFDTNSRLMWREGSSGMAVLKPNFTHDQFVLGLAAGVGYQVIIGEYSAFDKDFDHAAQTNPTLYVHSVTDPDTLNTEWISLTHDQTDAFIDTGKGDIRLGARVRVDGPLNLLGAALSELTIATGVITITAGAHTVDTEADAASDDLDTISGARDGDILVIVPANAARTVVAKHGTGNLNLSAGVDFTMDEDDDFLVLLLIGSTWQEVSRSENHA